MCLFSLKFTPNFEGGVSLKLLIAPDTLPFKPFCGSSFVLVSSNFHPKDLYSNGLQRNDFIPFIDLITGIITFNP